MSPLFVITRQDPIDDALEAEALGLGFEVVREALLETEPGVDLPVLPERIQNLPEGTAIAWTSRRAADALVRALPRDKKKLAKVPMYAVGESTAAPLRHAGYAPRSPVDALGASELAGFIADHARADGVKRVLFLHGNRALPDLPDGLRERGIEVEYLEVYRTRFLTADLSGLQISLREDTPIVAAFFSPSGVEALERFLTPNDRDRFRKHAQVIARGPTTAQALTRLGYPNVFVPREVPFHEYALEALHAHSGGAR